MKIKLVYLLTALFCLSSINCTKKQTTTGNNDTEYTLPPVDTVGAVGGDWIIQRELADPQGLNPITLQDATGREFSYHVFERLMWAYDRTTYDIYPWLAEAPPEETPDHLNFTYRIKKNITF